MHGGQGPNPCALGSPLRRQPCVSDRLAWIALRHGALLVVPLLVGAVVSACSGSSNSAKGSVSHSITGRGGPSPIGTTLPPNWLPPTSAIPSNCQSGSVTMTASVPPPPRICLHSGASLTVVFEKAKPGIGVPGPWQVPPQVVPSGFLAITSTSQSAGQLTANFKATTAGAGTVIANYGNQCAASDTTPCTIPPATEISLSVTVVSP
jgi:hypothetical protein